MYKEKVLDEMKKIFKDVPFGIDHTLKVLKNAEDIMDGESVREEIREVVTLAAILHDIGAIEAQRKHGSMEGTYQEQEGPPIAREILVKLGYNPANTDRVCYIIGNHHNPSKIDGIDFQIQWEADLLENLTAVDYKNEQQKIRRCIDDNFKTATGRSIAYSRFIAE